MRVWPRLLGINIMETVNDLPGERIFVTKRMGETSESLGEKSDPMGRRKDFILHVSQSGCQQEFEEISAWL